jgi:hypothetical protein
MTGLTATDTPPIAQQVANLRIAERIGHIPTNRHHDDFVLKPPTEEPRIGRRARRRHTASVQGRRGLPDVCNRTVKRADKRCPKRNRRKKDNSQLINQIAFCENHNYLWARLSCRSTLLLQVFDQSLRCGTLAVPSEPFEPFLQLLFAHLSLDARHDVTLGIDENGRGRCFAHGEFVHVVPSGAVPDGERDLMLVDVTNSGILSLVLASSRDAPMKTTPRLVYRWVAVTSKGISALQGPH